MPKKTKKSVARTAKSCPRKKTSSASGSPRLKQESLFLRDMRKLFEETASALTSLSITLDAWVKIEQLRFEKSFPDKQIRTATLATARYVKPGEEVEEEGDSVGKRERAALAREEKQARRSTGTFRITA